MCLLFWMWVKNYNPLKGSYRAEVLLSRITENKDVLSANNLAFEDNPDKSLIYIKNNNGPSIEALKTSVLTSEQSETCSFNENVEVSQKAT